MINGKNYIFFPLFIMVAFGDSKLGPENHCACNCTKPKRERKREENITELLIP